MIIRIAGLKGKPRASLLGPFEIKDRFFGRTFLDHGGDIHQLPAVVAQADNPLRQLTRGADICIIVSEREMFPARVLDAVVFRR